MCVGSDDGGRWVTGICLEKKVSDIGAKGQGERPARSLGHWLRCQLHNLTWDHCSLLIIIYEGFVSHSIILSLGVICFDMNQGCEPWKEPRIRPN